MPVKNLWPKVATCCVLLALAAANQFGGDWHSFLAWPWNGLSGIAGVIAEAISPLVLIYLVILLKQWAKL